MKSLNDDVNKATEKLNDVFKSGTFDESTQNAMMYFQANKNKLKYLLLAYSIRERHDVLLDHLDSQFGKINRHMLAPYLNKCGIITVSIWDNISFGISIVSALNLYALILILFDMTTFGKIVSIVPAFIFFIFLMCGLDEKSKSKARTYFLQSEYKQLARPKKIL